MILIIVLNIRREKRDNQEQDRRRKKVRRRADVLDFRFVGFVGNEILLFIL